MSDNPTRIHRLEDRAAIQDAILRYARGVDRRAWDFVRSAFHADALIDTGDFKGGVEGFIEGSQARGATVEQSAHAVSNILVEFTGPNDAAVETYYTARQRNAQMPLAMREALLGAEGRPGNETVELTALGRYIDRFERRTEGWRIARRIMVVESVTIAPAARQIPNPAWTMQRRDRDDALFRLRAELGLDGPVG